VRIPPHTPTAVLALAILALAVSPCVAGDAPKTDGTKVPVIRIIIDHENHLALVPEGTIIPNGLRIFSTFGVDSDDERTDLAPLPTQRPLVFSYAPAERFSHFARTSEVRVSPDDIAIVESDGRPQPEAATASQACPSEIDVEVGPDIIHHLVCTYFYNSLGYLNQQVVGNLTYPTNSILPRMYWVKHYNNGATNTWDPRNCFPSAGACGSGMAFYLPISITSLDARANVRLPGPCTQDPPFCPTYSSVVSYPIRMP
jgi:hypothetical protein